MAFTTFEKSATSVLDYTFDWSEWLVGSDTITSSSWELESGLTQSNATYGDTQSTVFIGGGSEGSSYFVSNTVETSEGLTATRSFIIKVTLR